jgi:hypothetical protein
MKKDLPMDVITTSSILTQIYTTTNYSMFGFVCGNRNLNNSNLNKIKQSISKKHIKTNAVICILDEYDKTKPLKIVDGQHRFEACQSLNIPVSYVIDNDLAMDSILNDITLINTASKEWDVSDFMGSEAQKGNQNYILYSSVYGMFSNVFDHEALYYILNNKPDRETKIKMCHSLFKTGVLSFNETDYNYLLDRLNNLSQFNQYSEIGGKRHYQKALNQLFNTDGFNPGQMLSKLQLRKSNIVKCTSTEGALRQLADIYNWKSQSGRILFLGTKDKIEEIIIK